MPTASDPAAAYKPHQVEGWDGHWFPLARGFSLDEAVEWARRESASRCDVRVTNGDGKPIARWLMGGRTIV